MAQNDFAIPNQGGQAFRLDVQDALQSLAGHSSGATDPNTAVGTTYPYQFWADTNNSVMKMRNGADSGWIALFQLDGEWSTIAFENGTAAAPSIYFKDSGTDTGFYSPGANKVGISTGGTSALVVDASQRVGLGTSSPGALLHTSQTSAGTAVIGSYLQNSSTDLDTEVRLALAANTQLVSNSRYAYISAVNPVATENGNALVFGTNPDGGAPQERVRIDSSGRVGIGTTSPQTRLDVTNTSAGTDPGHISLYNASSTAGTTCSIYFGPNTVGNARAAIIKGINSAGGGGGNPTDLAFFTNPDGGGPQERARIDSSGRLLVGTSSDSGGALLQVNGNRIRIATAKTPASATDTGTAGEICWDADYVYVCTATNTWKRTAIATW